LHVTLCTLRTHVAIPPGIVAAASSAAAALSVRPFAFAFDRALSFSGRESRPFVLCGGENIGALVAFRQRLATALAAQGLGRFSAPGFTPHVTLGYDRQAIEPLAVAELRWDVTEFALVHSVQGRSRHVVLDRWPLRA
jgi:2'-5' RNA ligase